MKSISMIIAAALPLLVAADLLPQRPIRDPYPLPVRSLVPAGGRCTTGFDESTGSMGTPCASGLQVRKTPIWLRTWVNCSLL